MKISEIERLLAKYYEGQTSLEEEKMLGKFFSESEVPYHLQPDKEIFLNFLREQSKESPDLENDILKAIQDSEKMEKESRKVVSRRLYRISGVAAGLLMLIGSYYFLQSNTMQDTYNNPQLAYNETKKILSYVSSKMNKGIEPVQQSLHLYDNGTNELGKLSKISKGIDDVQLVAKFYEKADPLAYLDLLNKPGEIITKYTKK